MILKVLSYLSDSMILSPRQYLPFEASSPSLPFCTLLSACVRVFCLLLGFCCINTGNVWSSRLYCLGLSEAAARSVPLWLSSLCSSHPFCFLGDAVMYDCRPGISLTRFHKNDLLGKSSDESAWSDRSSWQKWVSRSDEVCCWWVWGVAISSR